MHTQNTWYSEPAGPNVVFDNQGKNALQCNVFLIQIFPIQTIQTLASKVETVCACV